MNNADDVINAAELCALIGCSVYTLNLWYKFKKQEPDNKYSKMLPDPQYKSRQRYWYKEDVPKILKFKTSIPHGRNGILGSVSQKYVKKKSSTTGSTKD